MGIRVNLAAGVLHSFWGAALAIAVVPFYLRYLGIEAYGLIGFFTAMQAILAFLDMGMGPTTMREVARFMGRGSLAPARDLVRTLAVIYWSIAALIAVSVWLLAPWIAEGWLKGQTLTADVLSSAVMLMGVIIAIRFPISLYGGALAGAHRLALVSTIGIVAVTLANVGAVVVLAFVSPTIEAFFVWQALAAVLYVIAMQVAAWRVLGEARSARFDVGQLKRVWRFSASMAGAATIGAIFMQSDKVVLSSIVSLEDFGRYSLAAVIARSLYLFTTPAFNVAYPRLTTLLATGDETEARVFYKTGTRMMMAVVFSAAAFVTVFSREIFLLWTGEVALGGETVAVVGLLLLGTAINGIMHFPYAAQLAAGKSHLPLIINAGLLVVFVPMLLYLASNYGLSGAAGAWALLNFFYLIVGTYLTHRVIFRGIAVGWLAGDVGIPFLTSLLFVAIGGTLVQATEWGGFARLAAGAGLAGLAVLATVLVSPGLIAETRHLTAFLSRKTQPQPRGPEG